MSFRHRIAMSGKKSAQQKAEMINERRSQALKWLARNDKKKQPDTVIVKK